MWAQTNWGTLVGTADYRHPNVSQPPVRESQAVCGGVRDIDQAAPYIRTPVRYSKVHRTAVLEICDLHFGTQRQSAMRRRQFVVVERRAARGKVPPERRSVPARETVLDASSLDVEILNGCLAGLCDLPGRASRGRARSALQYSSVFGTDRAKSLYPTVLGVARGVAKAVPFRPGRSVGSVQW
jgi:hypothetical protein